MSEGLNILYCEDSAMDARLVKRVLSRRWPDVEIEQVDTAQDMTAMLGDRAWDAVLSDQMMPGFSAGAALRVLKEARSDIPFIVVSGAIGMGEAVELMKAGAHDFIRKDDLVRLVPALERELIQAENRREKAVAEDRLNRRNQQIRLLLESTSEGIYAVDTKGECIICNPAAARMLGFESVEQAIGRSLHRIAHCEALGENAIDEYDCLVCRVSRGERASSTVEDGAFTRLDGSTFPVSFRANPMYDGDLIIGAVVSFDDMTERKAAEEQRLELERQLFQIQKMDALGMVAGGIAHDFNNLLVPIIGLTQRTRKELPEDSKGWIRLEKVLEAADRAKDLVARILTFSRREDLEPKPLRLEDVANEAVEMLRSTLPSSIDFRVSVEPLPGAVLADATQLVTVMMNLGGNAADAMDGHVGAIDVELRPTHLNDADAKLKLLERPGDYARMVFRDNGEGMDEMTLARVFEPFFTTKAVGRGTGMGLATVHGIIQKHGGAISATSKLGAGTEFEILLPIVEEAA